MTAVLYGILKRVSDVLLLEFFKCVSRIPSISALLLCYIDLTGLTLPLNFSINIQISPPKANPEHNGFKESLTVRFVFKSRLLGAIDLRLRHQASAN